MLDLPKNGPTGQEGLSYWARRGDLLLVFVHTLWSGLGGEGFVETEWLEQTLREHKDARHRLVVGHHPAYPVNGYAGDYQRTIAPECVDRFWEILVEHDVTAYLCSHILAYDAQVHCGVLQICTAGAGTAHRMPEGDEFLHAMQVALDDDGLRCQVLDTDGIIRETLSWPRAAWSFTKNKRFLVGRSSAEFDLVREELPVRFEFIGTAASDGEGKAQTLLAMGEADALSSLWIGLRGQRQRLTVVVGNEPGRSPHYWFGPELTAGASFAIEVLLHRGMGPCGILCRSRLDGPWTSLSAASSWGLERMLPAPTWSIGQSSRGAEDLPFRGDGLIVNVSRACS